MNIEEFDVSGETITVGINNKELTGVCVDKSEDALTLVVMDTNKSYKTLFMNTAKIAYVARKSTKNEKESHDKVYKMRGRTPHG